MVKDTQTTDEMIEKARLSLENIKLENEDLTEFQIYLLERINLDMSILKDSLRRQSIQ